MQKYKPELWKIIEGFPYYKISNYGRVKSYRFTVPRLLKVKTNNKSKYLRVSLRQDGITIDKYIHILVAEAFIDNPLHLKEVNHKFGIPTDNYYEHLEWCTHKENMQHAKDSGLLKFWSQGVSQTLEDGTVIEFKSIREAARITGISKTGIEHNLKSKKNMIKYKCKFKKTKYEQV